MVQQPRGENTPKKAEIIGLLVAGLTLVVALGAWLSPVQPVSDSPFARESNKATAKPALVPTIPPISPFVPVYGNQSQPLVSIAPVIDSSTQTEKLRSAHHVAKKMDSPTAKDSALSSLADKAIVPQEDLFVMGQLHPAELVQHGCSP